MKAEQLPLGRQLELVFKEIQPELNHLQSGTLSIQIRENVVGKFGIRHLPIESREGQFTPHHEHGLSEIQQRLFRKMITESLKNKQHWTHGEIVFDFAVRRGEFCASVMYESNYNMSSLRAKG